MPKVSKLTGVQLVIENDKLVSADATYNDVIDDGGQTYQLPPRTVTLAGDDAAQVQQILGEALVAATTKASEDKRAREQSDKVRADLENKLATIQSKVSSTDGLLQQLSTERDQMRGDLDNQVSAARDLQKQLENVTAERDALARQLDDFSRSLSDRPAKADRPSTDTEY